MYSQRAVDNNESRRKQLQVPATPVGLEGHMLQFVRGSIVKNLFSRVGVGKAVVTEVILAMD